MTKGVLGLPPKRAKAKDGDKTCGACTWLDTPFTAKKSCRTHHGADNDTEICGDFTKINPKKLVTIDSLRRNTKVATVLSMLEDDRFIIDPTLEEELLKIQGEVKAILDKETGLPTYTDSEDDLDRIATAITKVQAFRDRNSEIYMSMEPIRRKLNKLWEMGEWELTQYPLIGDQPTESRRKVVLGQIMEELKEQIELCKSITKLSEYLDNYINSTHFMIKEFKELAMKAMDIRMAARWRT